MMRNFSKMFLCARQALGFSHGQDPERTFGIVMLDYHRGS
jgi:hypothetical protein